MAQSPVSLNTPLDIPMVDRNGKVVFRWSVFFRMVKDLLTPLGRERVFTLVNNQASAADIEGLQFDKAKVSAAFVDFLIQRVTTSTGAVELLESGLLFITYRPTALDWDMTVLTAGPDDAGITFSVDAEGQVKYISTNELGTEFITVFGWRARTLSVKNQAYSEAG